MDISAFVMGVSATLIGVAATVLSTRKIKSIEMALEAEKQRNVVYTELNDLAEQCAKDIELMYNNYCTIYKLKRGLYREDQVQQLIFPRPPMMLLLESATESCFHILTREQRDGIRSVISLVSSANQDSEYLHYNTKASNFAGADEARFRLYLSTLCALYHASINLSLEKERFKTIEKSPEETFTSVIKSLGFSMETADIFAHKIEA